MPDLLRGASRHHYAPVQAPRVLSRVHPEAEGARLLGLPQTHQPDGVDLSRAPHQKLCARSRFSIIDEGKLFLRHTFHLEIQRVWTRVFNEAQMEDTLFPV